MKQKYGAPNATWLQNELMVYKYRVINYIEKKRRIGPARITQKKRYPYRSICGPLSFLCKFVCLKFDR